MDARTWITPSKLGDNTHYTVRFEWTNGKFSFDRVLGLTEDEREAEEMILSLKNAINEDEVSLEMLQHAFPRASDFIDGRLNKLFVQLKSDGFVMVYDDRLAEQFTLFLNHIEYPYSRDNSRNHHAPERNRFETLK